ncbi:hypothetical protein PVAP13_8NG071001 [Panicum virgatum]|uniref:Uncharacterized protein n=1 Tax=Panicum virgatum TaxID=38727 RepID=A0A8T0P822_PANVG|nr:hypothetical protein PVAP13_8NG071001 [Panicum virgatum]
MPKMDLSSEIQDSKYRVNHKHILTWPEQVAALPKKERQTSKITRYVCMAFSKLTRYNKLNHSGTGASRSIACFVDPCYIPRVLIYRITQDR